MYLGEEFAGPEKQGLAPKISAEPWAFCRTPKVLFCRTFLQLAFHYVKRSTEPSHRTREGVNREKLTVKKIINNEMFFFTVYVRYKQ